MSTETTAEKQPLLSVRDLVQEFVVREGGGTRVTYSLHFEGRGPAKLMEPIVKTVMRAEIGMLPNLKAYLERNGR